MEPKLKQRLVGAGVVLALAVVIIPMLLDGSGERELRKIPRMPKAEHLPENGFVKPDAIPLPETLQARQPLPAPEARPAPEPKPESEPKSAVAGADAPKPPAAPATEKPEPAAVSPKPADTAPAPAADKEKKRAEPGLEAWVVQLGSFTEQDTAFKLRDELRSRNYQSFVEKFQGRNGQGLYRVRVGPTAKRETAEQWLLQLKKEKGYEEAFHNSYITSHP